VGLSDAPTDLHTQHNMDNKKKPKHGKRARVASSEIGEKPHKKQKIEPLGDEQEIKADTRIAVAAEGPELLRALKTYGPFVVHEPIEDGFPHVVLVTTTEQCDEILKVLVMSFLNDYNPSVLNRKDVVFGFDIEFHGTKPVTIQLSTLTLAVVFHFAKFKGGIPSSLKAFLESSECLKAGVGVVTDALSIKQHFGIKIKGILDVGIVASDITGGYYKLDVLARDLLDIPKRSTWTSIKNPTVQLSTGQIEYAAIDAWLGIRIAQHLFEALCATDQQMYAWCKSKETGRTISPGVQIALKQRDVKSHKSRTQGDKVREKRRALEAKYHITQARLEGVAAANNAYKAAEHTTLDLVSEMRSTINGGNPKESKNKKQDEDDLLINFV